MIQNTAYQCAVAITKGDEIIMKRILLKKIPKRALVWAFILIIFSTAQADHAMAGELSSPTLIYDTNISDIQFHEDGSLKSMLAAITFVNSSDYNGFYSAQEHTGALALHTEKFGTMNADPTGGMQYYLYNGPGGEGGDQYWWREVTNGWYGESKSDYETDHPGYWEHHLYKDFSCLEKGSMTTSRPIYGIEWSESGTGKPEDCYFVTWCQDANNSVDFTWEVLGSDEYGYDYWSLNVLNSDDERYTFTKTFVFPKGLIAPGEKQVYYLYYWNKWTNQGSVENGWWNPDGIYPDRLLFTLDTSNGLVFAPVTDDGNVVSSNNDTAVLTGGTHAGEILTAQILDENGQDASGNWTEYQWLVDGQTVAKDTLNYTIRSTDLGKEITFLCYPAAGNNHIGALLAKKQLADAPLLSLPATGDDAPLLLSASMLLFSLSGLVWMFRRRRQA